MAIANEENVVTRMTKGHDRAWKVMTNSSIVVQACECNVLKHHRQLIGSFPFAS